MIMLMIGVSFFFFFLNKDKLQDDIIQHLQGKVVKVFVCKVKETIRKPKTSKDEFQLKLSRLQTKGTPPNKF